MAARRRQPHQVQTRRSPLMETSKKLDQEQEIKPCTVWNNIRVEYYILFAQIKNKLKLLSIQTIGLKLAINQEILQGNTLSPIFITRRFKIFF